MKRTELKKKSCLKAKNMFNPPKKEGFYQNPSTLKSNTSLKSNTVLKSNSKLKANSKLNTKTNLKINSELKCNSTLKSKSVLKSKSEGLRSKETLKNKGTVLSCNKKLEINSTLKQFSELTAKTELKAEAKLKIKQTSAKKSQGEYKSIFGDLSRCCITGEKKKKIGKGKWNVVPHHIFSGPYKSKSEEYGFILPLRIDWHTGYSYSIHEDDKLDKKYKRMCEEYYINILGKTKEEFVYEFGRSYL